MRKKYNSNDKKLTIKNGKLMIIKVIFNRMWAKLILKIEYNFYAAKYTKKKIKYNWSPNTVFNSLKA